MSELTIKHDREDGTLIYGTARGDGTAEILKANRWRWSRNLGMWFVPSSRDRAAKTWIIRATETALRAADFAVTVEIDDTYRPTALVEADRAERQADRVEALHEKAERRHGHAAAALAADIRATEALPPGGEPIKIGHHSEGPHRRALDKAWAATGKRIAAEDAAREADRRASASEHTTEFRNNPRVTLRRIKALEAELRGTERSRDGYTRTLFIHPQTGQKVTEEHAPATGEWRERLEARIAELEDKLAYRGYGALGSLVVQGGTGQRQERQHRKRVGRYLHHRL
ncbi:DUF3560 domain-containing protein [Nocardia brasiliensis]|uniref:DUF3560 domain-containing protein n=1 Tax=Nocardia brasiliensis TaxID=37326 RepID=UPI0024541B92|nr:DUF3560 domain-containing protein [Nocardia brasiliensis]